MTIKTITAGHSRKEGRPNYGSEDFHFSLTLEVAEGEDLTELAKSMFETCRAKVNEQFAAEKPAGKIPFSQVGHNPKLFDWKNTPGGQAWIDAKNEQTEDYGLDNGPRGSKFEG